MLESICADNRSLAEGYGLKSYVCEERIIAYNNAISESYARQNGVALQSCENAFAESYVIADRYGFKIFAIKECIIAYRDTVVFAEVNFGNIGSGKRALAYSNVVRNVRHYADACTCERIVAYRFERAKFVVSYAA